MGKLMKLIGISAFGVIVSVCGGCAVEDPQEEEDTGEELPSNEASASADAAEATLISAETAPELRDIGAIVKAVRGGAPELVSGSVRAHSPDELLPEDLGDGAQGLDASALPAGQADSLAPNLFEDGQFTYSSGLWGTSYDVVVSRKCNGHTRDYAEAYAFNNNGGYCAVVGWLTGDPSDCRFIVHVGASKYKSGTCQWNVYANETGSFSYSASNTNNAQQNTTNASIYLSAGQKLSVGTCGVPGATASGDTYLRLFDGGALVSANDDACGGLSSFLVYTSPSDKKYELRAGCYGSGSCSGTVTWAKQP